MEQTKSTLNEKLSFRFNRDHMIIIWNYYENNSFNLEKNYYAALIFSC